ncbi:MAG TPA: prolyl oligopeptidase family serine peptidase [Verrucomicrobiae bacterium]|nr:prolyl oligopeptidase family serine peptidase [Verrucomicrobiae bacterium]
MPNLHRLALLPLLCALLGTTAPAQFSLSDVLSYPFPSTLVRSADGKTIAFAIDQRGAHSIWVATAPRYEPKEVLVRSDDDGRAISSVGLSADGSRLVYVQGSSENPSLSVQAPGFEISSIVTASGVKTELAQGRAPALSPDGSRVAFLDKDEVWIVPSDGSAPAKRLFYDAGKDWDLQWSPQGDALAFVSARGDHSFIGVYRGDDRPLEFLAPSVTTDLEPRWSPDGEQIVFARTPGNGGALQSPLERPIVPWSIWVARVADGSVRQVWQSAHTARASFPTQGGDVDLTWIGNARIAFLCSADGWPHLYVAGSNGGAAKQLTFGAYDVFSIIAADDGRSVYYVANTGPAADDVDRWHLFRADAISGHTVAVSGGNGSQWWPTPLAGGMLAYANATAQQPPLVAVATAAGRGARLIDAALVPSNFPQAALVTPREVRYRAPDGTMIHAQLFVRNATTRGPAIVFVHGGPMRQMLLTWNPMGYYANSYAVNQYLAARGFAVLSVNYRSGVGYGYDFHYALHAGWTGASEYQDVLAGARWLQAQHFVDPARIGIWGGSWGGYLTALALARNSDVFKAGVDYSGVHDLMHDALDYFRDGGEGSARVDRKPWLALAWKSSPVGAIATWRSPVLLIQGDEDPDVAFHQLVDLVPRLQAQHVPYQLIVLPDEAHSFLRWGSWLETDSAAAAFFERYLR